MKKSKIFILLLVVFPLSFFGQYAFTPNIYNGNYMKTYLDDASQISIGASITDITASDFGSDGKLYAIRWSDNGFYEIDTADGSATLLGTNPPPANHSWTGMAFDKTTGNLYASSSWATAAGATAIHIIDETNGSYTTVGSQSIATGISCIGIDDNGQMYGMEAGAFASIYLIDKTDGSVTFLGNTGEAAAGRAHGMDYSSPDQTMYLVTNNSAGGSNTLRTIDLSNGNTTFIGSYNSFIGTMAVVPEMTCDFSSDVTTVCAAGTVHFYDESYGAETYAWVFEGGTPSTSAYQNPSVNYSTPGTYDVELTVSNSGGSSETEIKVDYITVNVAESGFEISGENIVCDFSSEMYEVEDHEGSTYTWEVTGGAIADGQGTYMITVDWNGEGDGIISVQEETADGCEGDSEEFEVLVDDCTGVIENSIGTVSVHPNPASDFLNIVADNPIETVKVYELTGKAVFQSQVGSDKYILNTSDLMPGMYMVEIRTAQTRVVKRVIVK